MKKSSIYSEIGVNPVINASGTKTTHGGTQMSEDVIEAMKIASYNFVSIQELNEKVGDYIASITEAEAGMVTSGAASGVVLSIAACMTGTNKALIRQLPDSSGMKNEVIIQRIHMGAYAHMYSFSGCKIIEIGNINNCSDVELRHAINEKTAAIAYLFGPRISPSGLSFPEVVSIGKNYSIPVIVDAAAMLPPKSNLSEYIKQGADLVTISGGKFLKGPQNSGLLFGKKDLIEAAIANSNPNHAIGRPHKVSKEVIVGLYKALKNYIALDEEKLLLEYKKRLKEVLPYFSELKQINAELIHDWINYSVPVIAISSRNKLLNLKQLPNIMLQNSPRIFLQYFAELGHLVINPISLTVEELKIVAKSLSSNIEELCKRNKI